TPLTPQGGKRAPKKKPDPTRAEGFDTFWSAYPRHEAKAKAAEVWANLRPDAETRARIDAALSWQRASDQWTRDGGRFVPLPATYLHQRRWEDEPPSGARKAESADERRAMQAKQRALHEAERQNAASEAEIHRILKGGPADGGDRH